MPLGWAHLVNEKLTRATFPQAQPIRKQNEARQRDDERRE
jgi:hypothetical protein